MYVEGYSWLYQDLAQARKHLVESHDLHQELGNKWGVARVLMGLARVARNEGELEEARDMALQSLTLSRELNCEDGTGAALLLLGNLAVWRAELEEAEKLLRQGLALSTGVAGTDTPWGQAVLGWVHFLRGRFPEAEALWQSPSLSIPSVIRCSTPVTGSCSKAWSSCIKEGQRQQLPRLTGPIIWYRG